MKNFSKNSKILYRLKFISQLHIFSLTFFFSKEKNFKNNFSKSTKKTIKKFFLSKKLFCKFSSIAKRFQRHRSSL